MTFSARIHVLLARKAPVGVVIRRGPSKQVCTLLWDRKLDRFHMGQWLKGRIYERRCDISPDGKYFIYFAMTGRWGSETKGAYSAISKAPYLKALALFPKGDCWNGGGLFTANDRFWLNDGCRQTALRDTKLLKRDQKFAPADYYGGECPGVYYPRLLRDGWKLIERVSKSSLQGLDIFEKNLGAGWMLKKIAHAEIGSPPGKGCYWDEHELVNSSNSRIACADWEWAEVDGQRLVWAKEGRLFAATMTKGGLVNEVELFDFNGMTFEPIEAPY